MKIEKNDFTVFVNAEYFGVIIGGGQTISDLHGGQVVIKKVKPLLNRSQFRKFIKAVKKHGHGYCVAY